MSLNGEDKGNTVKGNKGRGKCDKNKNTGETRNNEEESKSQEGSVGESTQIGTKTFDEFLMELQGSKKKSSKKKKKKGIVKINKMKRTVREKMRLRFL